MNFAWYFKLLSKLCFINFHQNSMILFTSKGGQGLETLFWIESAAMMHFTEKAYISRDALAATRARGVSLELDHQIELDLLTRFTLLLKALI
jgi:hypothetical protein